MEGFDIWDDIMQIVNDDLLNVEYLPLPDPQSRKEHVPVHDPELEVGEFLPVMQTMPDSGTPGRDAEFNSLDSYSLEDLLRILHGEPQDDATVQDPQPLVTTLLSSFESQNTDSEKHQLTEMEEDIVHFVNTFDFGNTAEEAFRPLSLSLCPPATSEPLLDQEPLSNNEPQDKVPQINPELLVDPEPQLDSEPLTDPESQMDRETLPDHNALIDPRPQLDTEPLTELESQMDRDLEALVDPEPLLDTEPLTDQLLQMNTEPLTDLESQMDRDAEALRDPEPQMNNESWAELMPAVPTTYGPVTSKSNGALSAIIGYNDQTAVPFNQPQQYYQQYTQPGTSQQCSQSVYRQPSQPVQQYGQPVENQLVYSQFNAPVQQYGQPVYSQYNAPVQQHGQPVYSQTLQNQQYSHAGITNQGQYVPNQFAVPLQQAPATVTTGQIPVVGPQPITLNPLVTQDMIRPIGVIDGQMMYEILTGQPVTDICPAPPTKESTSRKRRRNNKDDPTYVKRPPNSFMLFKDEHRLQVMAELNIKDSKQVNIVLGQRWRMLSQEEQFEYYVKAQKVRRLHEDAHPNGKRQRTSTTGNNDLAAFAPSSGQGQNTATN